MKVDRKCQVRNSVSGNSKSWFRILRIPKIHLFVWCQMNVWCLEFHHSHQSSCFITLKWGPFIKKFLCAESRLLHRIVSCSCYFHPFLLIAICLCCLFSQSSPVCWKKHFYYTLVSYQSVRKANKTRSFCSYPHYPDPFLSQSFSIQNLSRPIYILSIPVSSSIILWIAIQTS